MYHVSWNGMKVIQCMSRKIFHQLATIGLEENEQNIMKCQYHSAQFIDLGDIDRTRYPAMAKFTTCFIINFDC